MINFLLPVGVRESAIPLTHRSRTTDTSSVDFNSKDSEHYDQLVQAVGDADVVLIGEASHGTHVSEVCCCKKGKRREIGVAWGVTCGCAFT